MRLGTGYKPAQNYIENCEKGFFKIVLVSLQAGNVNLSVQMWLKTGLHSLLEAATE